MIDLWWHVSDNYWGSQSTPSLKWIIIDAGNLRYTLPLSETVPSHVHNILGDVEIPENSTEISHSPSEGLCETGQWDVSQGFREHSVITMIT